MTAITHNWHQNLRLGSSGTHPIHIKKWQNNTVSLHPEAIFETPVGMDPDFWSQRTRTLGLMSHVELELWN